MSDVYSISLGGIQSGADRLARSAKNIARMNQPDSDVDLATEVVEQKIASVSVKANAAALKTADEMQGTLLDMIG